MNKKLLILSQIGSPSEPKPQAVGRYLSRFLMDKRVLDMPFLLRFLLVHLGIVWRRKSKSAIKYKKIWTNEGSPLVVETKKFALSLKKYFPDTDIVIHWRYGDESPDDLLKPYVSHKYDEVLIAPLYPQYAEATTESALDVLVPLVKSFWPMQTQIKVLKPFFNSDEFLASWIDRIESITSKDSYFLFSFHGLPVSQLKKATGCDQTTCCNRRDNDSKCYLAQCKETVNLLAGRLKLAPDQYSYSFQSRVGPSMWLEPSTGAIIEDLVRNKKIKSLMVVCPSFVTDGLETLEEIDIELRQSFLKSGGESFKLIRSLNHESSWVLGFSKILNQSNNWVRI